MDVVRLRYRVDNLRLLRNHLHLAGDAGYFFFPDGRASAEPGAPVHLELELHGGDDSASVRGIVWARSRAGLWIELPGAARLIERLERAPDRGHRRIAGGQLVLLERPAGPGTLCRLADVSLGGARIAMASGEPGRAGERVFVSAPDGDERGAAQGRIVWANGGALGLVWARADLVTRAAVLRFLEQADAEWETARTATHPARCRCAGDASLRAPILLLG